MIDIRTPTEDERQQVFDVLLISLNLSSNWVEERGPHIRLDDFSCAYEGDRLVGAAAGWRFRQWFGGREVPTNGVYAVATLPEVRGMGLASRMVTEVMRRGREDGAVLSALYPAALHPYRALGYELAGTYTEHTVPLGELPIVRGGLTVREYEPGDLDDVRACYRAFARDHNGPIDCDDEEAWWRVRIMERISTGKASRAVVVLGDEGIEGYSAFHYEPAKGDLSRISYGIECTHLVAITEPALRSLLGYFRGFRGIGETLTWMGPPANPAMLLVDEQKLKPTRTFRWMARLLDVPGAIEGRGYPAVSGEAVIGVDDPMFPENRGPWRIEADAGKVRVAPAEGLSPRPIPIGALSSLFTGFITPSDSTRLGHLDAGDPAVPLLAQLFAGPAPWMIDFF